MNNKDDNNRLYNYIKADDQMLEIKENRITFKINAKGKKIYLYKKFISIELMRQKWLIFLNINMKLIKEKLII